MCENPVGFLGFSGLKWVLVGLFGFRFVNFSLFVCMCVWV